MTIADVDYFQQRIPAIRADRRHEIELLRVPDFLLAGWSGCMVSRAVSG